jgi:hypothetical protein
MKKYLFFAIPESAARIFSRSHIIILDNLTIVEYIYIYFFYKKTRPVRRPGPAAAHRAPWCDTPRDGCMRRIRRRMKHAAPPRHREARRLDREAPGSTGKHRQSTGNIFSIYRFSDLSHRYYYF